MLGRFVGLGTHHRFAMGSDCLLRGVLCARGNFLPRYVFYLSLFCYLAIGARFGFLLGLDFLDDETHYLLPQVWCGRWILTLCRDGFALVSRRPLLCQHFALSAVL